MSKRPFFACSDHGNPYNMFGTDESLKTGGLVKEKILGSLNEEDIRDLDKEFLKTFGKKSQTPIISTMADEDFKDFLM